MKPFTQTWDRDGRPCGKLRPPLRFSRIFYTGVENILKRISYCRGVAMPVGDDWHTELFNRFCEPTFANLPVVFDADQQNTMAAYRRFRHVIRHGYAAQLDWDRMAIGVENAGRAYAALKAKLHILFGV